MKHMLLGLLALCLLAISPPALAATVVPQSGTILFAQKPDGSYVQVQVDASGNVISGLTPSATVGVTTQSCTVACASTIVSGAHAAYGLSGSATVAGWFLIYDATSCPANGTVTPKKAYAYTVANSTMGISWSDIPMVNATGIAVCFSSTGPYTATASTTAFLSVDYK